MRRSEKLPKLEECIKGRLYEVWCRNLALGIYDGNGGFIGIRTKFGDRYLFTEYHYDYDSHCGTVRDIRDTGVDLPEEIEPRESLGTVDQCTDRYVAFHRTSNEIPFGYWYFIDTGEKTPEKVVPQRVPNPALFKFLCDAYEEHVTEK